jgi:hypothetical protein
LFVAGAEAHISTQRFAFVDTLRGLAALSVVLYHASKASHIAGLLGTPADVGLRTCLLDQAEDYAAFIFQPLPPRRRSPPLSDPDFLVCNPLTAPSTMCQSGCGKARA